MNIFKLFLMVFACNRFTNAQISDIRHWMSAERPNYKRNVDLLFPYSEVDYVGECKLVKIPISLNNLIPHVDYWGEGKVVTKKGIRGFSNCYNVNHQYQLVSSGPDLDRKIPNRIPVLSDENCDTSSYIKNNSVRTVTVAEAARITSSCAKDIVRIVNKEQGIVVVYGVQNGSQNISEHAVELAKSLLDLGFISNDILPRELQVLTYYNTHLAFLKPTVLKNELFKYVVDGEYDTAVEIAKRLGVLKPSGESIYNIIMRLISICPHNTMSFAYKLWKDTSNIVRYQLPRTFQLIFAGKYVTIVNYYYSQPLTFAYFDWFTDYNYAWGDEQGRDKLWLPSLSWQFIFSRLFNGRILFKVKNILKHKFLILDSSTTGYKSVYAYNKYHPYVDFYLEPLIVKGTIVFHIIGCNNHALYLEERSQWLLGDRKLWGYAGNHKDQQSFMWIVKPWKSKDGQGIWYQYPHIA